MKYDIRIGKDKSVEFRGDVPKYALIEFDTSYHAPFQPKVIYAGDNDKYLVETFFKNIGNQGWNDVCEIRIFRFGKLVGIATPS